MHICRDTYDIENSSFSTCPLVHQVALPQRQRLLELLELKLDVDPRSGPSGVRTSVQTTGQSGVG
jgi:hypothetical protein